MRGPIIGNIVQEEVVKMRLKGFTVAVVMTDAVKLESSDIILKMKRFYGDS